jgi:hypothetical protein
VALIVVSDSHCKLWKCNLLTLSPSDAVTVRLVVPDDFDRSC